MSIDFLDTSTEDQQITRADQQFKLRQYADLHDHEIVEMFVGSESGKDIKGREELGRVLDRLRKRDVDVLLVLKLDRLTRNVENGLALVREFFGLDSNYKLTLLTIQDHVSTETAMGRFMFTLLLPIAALERETTAERARAARAHKARNGERVTRRPRYGLPQSRRLPGLASPSGRYEI